MTSLEIVNTFNKDWSIFMPPINKRKLREKKISLMALADVAIWLNLTKFVHVSWLRHIVLLVPLQSNLNVTHIQKAETMQWTLILQLDPI